jgi:hypothetical protein
MTDLPSQSAEIEPESEDPYEERRHLPKYDKRPHSIYFYYIYKDAGVYNVRHYYFDNVVAVKRNDLKDIATNLANNARLPVSAQDPQPKGTGINDIEWKRKSYLIVLIDDPAYELAKHRAIEFHYWDGDGGNHTFFDAKDLDVDLPRQQGGPGTERVSAVACLNHMKKNKNGNDLEEHDRQTFYFVLHPVLGPRIFPDDGGTNLGPPVPPPA